VTVLVHRIVIWNRFGESIEEIANEVMSGDYPATRAETATKIRMAVVNANVVL